MSAKILLLISLQHVMLCKVKVWLSQISLLLLNKRVISSEDKSRTVNCATCSDDDNWRKRKRINISLQHWLFLANARNGNSVQWQTQHIVHRRPSHNRLFFFTSLDFILKTSAWVCSGPVQSGSWTASHSAAESLSRQTPTPGKVPCCLPKPAASEMPANPSPSQGCSAWLVGEQALSLRNRQIFSDPFGMNTPVEGNEKFICIHIHWAVCPATPPAVYHIHRIRPQAREKVGR